MNAVIFTAMASMCILNYGAAILRDPGVVPGSFMPDIEDAETPIHEIKRKVSTALLILCLYSFLI